MFDLLKFLKCLFVFNMSVVDEDGGGTPENQNDGNENENQDHDKDDVVPKRELERVSNDMHKFKREAREAQERAEKMESKLKQLEEKGLENSEQYKDLAEKRKQELEEYKQKYEQTQQTVINDKKMSEVEKFAVKYGIRDGYFDLLLAHDMSDVEIETTSTGRINVIGAEDWVKSMKEQYKHLFRDENAANINNNPGNPNPSKKKELSPKEILELRKKDPAAYKEYRKSQMQR